MQKKFYLNENTGKLHIVDGCHHAQYIPKDGKVYNTEDDAISEQTRFMSYCKLCFKNKSL